MLSSENIQICSCELKVFKIKITKKTTSVVVLYCSENYSCKSIPVMDVVYSLQQILLHFLAELQIYSTFSSKLQLTSILVFATKLLLKYRKHSLTVLYR